MSSATVPAAARVAGLCRGNGLQPAPQAVAFGEGPEEIMTLEGRGKTFAGKAQQGPFRTRRMEKDSSGPEREFQVFGEIIGVTWSGTVDQEGMEPLRPELAQAVIVGGGEDQARGRIAHLRSHGGDGTQLTVGRPRDPQEQVGLQEAGEFEKKQEGEYGMTAPGGAPDRSFRRCHHRASSGPCLLAPRRTRGGIFGGGRSGRGVCRARLVQRFLEQAAGLEVGLAPGGNVDDLAGAGVSGRRLGPGVLDLEYAESPDLYAVAIDQAVPHGHEKTIDHLGCQDSFCTLCCG